MWLAAACSHLASAWPSVLSGQAEPPQLATQRSAVFRREGVVGQPGQQAAHRHGRGPCGPWAVAVAESRSEASSDRLPRCPETAHLSIAKSKNLKFEQIS